MSFKYKTTPVAFTIFLSFLTPSAFGQQFLWSTAKIDSVKSDPLKYIPLENVTKEVLKFYEQYQMYYDLSGYSKDRFVKTVDYNGGFASWNWLNDIKTLTVFAMRSNSGKGSFILVMCITKNNVNAIIFSNTTFAGSYDFQLCLPAKKEKFASWFNTLLE